MTTEIEVPTLSEALSDVSAYLTKGHEAFVALGILGKAESETFATKSADVRKDMRAELFDVLPEGEFPKCSPILDDITEKLSVFVGMGDEEVLLIAEHLQELTSHYVKYATWLVDNRISQERAEHNQNAADSVGAKERMLELRKNMDAVIQLSDVDAIPDGFPTEKGKDGGTIYAGKLPRGRGTGSGRPVTGSKLVFRYRGNVIETQTPRKVEEIIWRQMNPLLGTQMNSVSDLEEILSDEAGQDVTIFDTPWTYGGFECTTE